ncbi:Homoserine kinase [Streptomyces sp. enrichment culture]|uniref:phosphotransferase n=1 Tax=Streptomyces sp. enrichment culture TaxID=1795815 RepID=UPI003F55C0E7
MVTRLNRLAIVGAAEVNSVASTYGLGHVREFHECGEGMVNSNYRLDTDGGTYLLRLYAADRRREEIDLELSVLRHLGDAGFPVPRYVCARNGERVGELAGRLFTVLTYLPGRTLTQDELAHDIVTQVGSAYARMRLLLNGFVPDGRKDNAEEQLCGGLMDDVLKRLEAEDAEVAAEVGDVWSEVSPLFTPPTERQVVHGDLYFANTVVDEHCNLVGFIDFDDAYLGSSLLDLALVVMEFSTPADNVIDLDLVAALLRAYVAAGGPRPDTDVFPEALLFLCCKFLCYTAQIQQRQGEPIEQNDYLRRLRHLRTREVREMVRHRVERAVDTGR